MVNFPVGSVSRDDLLSEESGIVTEEFSLSAKIPKGRGGRQWATAIPSDFGPSSALGLPLARAFSSGWALSVYDAPTAA